LLLLTIVLFSTPTFAQSTDSIKAKSKESVPKNWHQLDFGTSGFQGISLDNAYEFLHRQGLTSKKVLVAVIDSGIDTLHEDLKPVLWVNKREILGNNKDDDKNGYVDDIHGWNFIGGKDGKNVKEDSYESARVYHQLKSRWAKFSGNPDKLSPSKKAEYIMFKKAEEAITEGSSAAEMESLVKMQEKLMKGDSVIRKEMAKEEYNIADLEKYTTNNKDAKSVKSMLIGIGKANNTTDITNTQILEEIEGAIRKADAANTPPEKFRKQVVGDKESKFKDKKYGNNDLMAETPFHGTHCSGIIGAARNNGVGVDGIADNVEIMMVRAVPDGDEHDKDIAYAIRYAVDNGARVISMSFGKDFSPQKQWVDDAFRYADAKGVLLVHAAGNDNKNIDTLDNFPTPNYIDGKGRTLNIITVGASGDPKNGGLTASFSNYGKKEVDVFAPGVNIYSTIPGGNTYGKASGTSMACPVVAGIAALIMEYYPSLTASQVKNIIEKSAIIPTEKVKLPGTSDKVMLSDISKTGGIVNAFEAVKMANTISGGK